jgi:hypothetical protein
MPASFQKNSESAFKQQRLQTKCHLFFVIGPILILIGIYLYVSNSVSYFFWSGVPSQSVNWKFLHFTFVYIGERVCLWLHRLYQPRESFILMCGNLGNGYNQSLHLCHSITIDGSFWSKFQYSSNLIRSKIISVIRVMCTSFMAWVIFTKTTVNMSSQGMINSCWELLVLSRMHVSPLPGILIRTTCVWLNK